MSEEDLLADYRRADHAALVDELIVAYELLSQAVPLAVQRLQQAGVELDLQLHFWRTLHELADVLEEDPADCVFERLPSYESNPYLMRHGALWTERAERAKKVAS